MRRAVVILAAIEQRVWFDREIYGIGGYVIVPRVFGGYVIEASKGGWMKGGERRIQGGI